MVRADAPVPLITPDRMAKSVAVEALSLTVTVRVPALRSTLFLKLTISRAVLELSTNETAPKNCGVEFQIRLAPFPILTSSGATEAAKPEAAVNWTVPSPVPSARLKVPEVWSTPPLSFRLPAPRPWIEAEAAATCRAPPVIVV